jgi:ribosome-associated protein
MSRSSSSHPPRSLRRWQSTPPPADPDLPLSKTKLKQEMTSLQELGKRLTELPPAKLTQLGLPEELVTAINDYRRFNKWEAMRRQMQYIGRLMRDIDAAPVIAQLDAWSHSTRESVAEFHAAEKWRDRLLTETNGLDAFVEAHPAADRARLADLIGRAHQEHAAGKPPASSRLLFREITKLVGAA